MARPWCEFTAPHVTLEELCRLLKMCDDHVAVQGINVFFNFLASFIIGQFFNTMLCSMQVCLQASHPTSASDVIVYI